MTVSAGQDADAADDEATITHAVAGGDYASATASRVDVTVDDDETASTKVTLTVSPVSVDEDATTTTVTVTGTLDEAPRTSDTGVTVSVGAAGDAATEGTDYASVSNFTLTISAGQTSGTKTFGLTPTDDDVDEEDETLTVSGTTTVTGLSVTDTTATIIDDDTRGVTVSHMSLPVTEGASATYTVVLTSQPTASVTVTPSRESGSSTDVTFSPSSLTFTTSTWATAKTVTVSAAPDADAEDDEATIEHEVAGGDYASETASDVAVTVDDGETASTKVTLSVSPASVAEDAEATTITVTGMLDEAPRTLDTEVTVSVGASGDGATEGTDYLSVANFTLTISAGQTSGMATFSLTPTDDDIDEDDDEALTVSGTTTVTGLSVVSTAVTIDDNETAAQRTGRGVTVTPTGMLIAEGTNGTYTVVLNTQPTASVTVTPSRESGSSSDVTFDPSSLTFTTSTWKTAKTVTVSAAEDADGEDDEATITHAVAGGEYASVTASSVEVTVDDDETASTKVTLSVSPVSVDEDAEGTTVTVTGKLDEAPRTSAASVTVSVGASGDGATEGTDYATVDNFTLTISAGQTSGTETFTLTPIDDDVDEDDETLTVSGTSTATGLSVTDTTATIIDDDTRGVTVFAAGVTVAEGGTETYTVVLQSQPTASVTVTPSVTDNPDVTIDPSPLTFLTSTWETAQTVTVSAGQDADAADDEATITHAVAGGDYASATASRVDVTVDDDETASTKVTLSVSPASVDEDAEATTVTVTGTLDEAPRTSDTEVTVSVGAAGDGATEGTDYASVANLTLTITVGQTSGTETFTLTPTDDDVDEEDETISVSGTTTAMDLSVTDTTATIIDDDTRGVTVSHMSLPVTEGATATYTVGLTSQPTASVTVTPSRDPGSSTDVSFSPSSLTFTTSTWETAKTVTVSAAEDADAVVDEATITHAVAGGDYTSETASDVDVTVTDNETASTKVTLSVSPASVDEDAEATTVTVTGTLDEAPRTSVASVTVLVGAVGDAATEGTDYATVDNFILSISAGQTSGTETFSLTPTDDDVDEEDETLTVSGTTTAMDLSVTDTTATIIDNDTRGVTVSHMSLPVTEGTTATYTVVLTSQPTASVTVTPSRGSGSSTDVTFSPSSLTFTTSTWETARTVTVSAAEDADAEDDDATIEHSVSGGDYASETASDVTVTVKDNEKPSTTVTLMVNPASVDEDAEATTVTVTGTLDGAPRTSATSVAVSVGAAGDAATEGTDYTSVANFTLTISAGQASGTATFTLTPTDDDLDEGDETLTVSGTTTVTGLSVTGMTATIIDDDTRGVTVSHVSLPVTEGASATYTVVLTSQPTASVTVTPSRESGSSTDVTFSPSSLTFTTSTWATAKTVTVSAAPDADAEDDKATIEHEVAGGDYASETASDVAVTVDDGETASTKVTLSVSPASVAEDAEATTITVTGMLDEAPRATNTEVTVSVGADGDGATEGTDYGSVDDFTLTISGGQPSGTATFTLTPDDDDVDEDDEALSVSGTAAGLSVMTTTASVTDDDERGVTVSPTSLPVTEGETAAYTVVLGSQPTASVIVTPSVTDNPDVSVAPSSLTFSTSTWETAQTVTVRAGEDADEEDASATIVHAVRGGDYASETAPNVTVAVTDNETLSERVTLTVSPALVGEDASPTTVTVKGTLNGAARTSVTRVTVSVGAAGDGATEGTDYASVVEFTLTIEAGQTSGTATFTLAPTDDDVDESDETLSVSGTTSATGLSVTGTTATVADNDERGVTVLPTTLTVTEGETATYTVALASQPTAGVTVTVGGTAGTDVSLSRMNLTFTTATWNTAQTVTVSAGEDADATDDRVGLTHTASGGDYGSVRRGLNVTVSDDDNDVAESAVGLVLSTDSLNVDEGGNARFNVSLASQPSASVAVAISGLTGTDLTTDPTSLGFATVDWNAPKAMTVSAAHDDDRTDDLATLTLTASGGNYGSVRRDLYVSVSDDDMEARTVVDVTVSFDQEVYTTVEGGTPARVTVRVVLNRDPERAVTVPLEVTLNGGATRDDYDGVPASIAFGSGEMEKSFQITAIDDEADDDGESLTVGFGALPNGVLPGRPATTLVLLEDNDIPVTAVSFDKSTYEVQEGGAPAPVTVRITLSDDPERELAVPLEVTLNGGATTDDYDGVPASITFGSGEMEKSFQITAIDDEADDDGESLTVGFGALPDGVLPGEPATASVHILDNDAPVVTVAFDRSIYQAEEGGHPARVTVSLSDDPERAVTVPLEVTLNGGTTRDDYDGVPASITFGSGEMEKSFQITAIDDEADDDGESLTIGFGALPDGVLPGEPATASVHILDNDAPVVTVAFDRSIYQAEEGGHPARVTVSLSTDPERQVAIPLTSTPGDGATEADYSGVPSVVNFNPGETAKTFEVIARDDAIDDDGESGTLGFGALAPSVDAGEQSTAVVRLIDNDKRGVNVSATYLEVPEGATAAYTVVLHSEPTASVVVAVTGSSGTDVLAAPMQLTFAAGDWDEPQEVMVRALEDDDAVEDQVTLRHTVSGGDYGEEVAPAVTVTVVEDDVPAVSILDQRGAEHVGALEFTVMLDMPSSEEAVVGYTTDNGSAQSGEDYAARTGTLRFPALATRLNISVPIIDDDVEEDTETFTVRLKDPVQATLVGELATATGKIEDNDAAIRALEILLSSVGRMVATEAIEVVGRRFDPRAQGHPKFRLGGQSFGAPGESRTDASGNPARQIQHIPPGQGPGILVPLEALMYRGRGNGEGTTFVRQMTVWDLLSRTDFSVPLSDGERAGGWTVWGRGAMSGFSGISTPARRVDANTFSSYVGIDYNVRAKALLGLALTHSLGDLNYAAANPARTIVPIDFGITTVLPYLHLQLHRRFGIWGLSGIGRGGIDLVDQHGNYNTDMSLLMGAGGARQHLASRGRFDLALKGDAFYVQAESDAGAWLPNVREEAKRVRMLIEGSRIDHFGSASRISQSLEIGGRWDRGRIENGKGLDIGGGVDYDHTGRGVSMAARGRYLLIHEQEGYHEWGASLILRINPGAGKRGLVVEASPVWGEPGSNGAGLWRGATGSVSRRERTPDSSPDQVKVDVGYQLLTPAGNGRITPYGGWATERGDYHSYRFGGRMIVGSSMKLDFESRFDKGPAGNATYRLRILGHVSW